MKYYSKWAFTLVEVLVSLAIFAIIMISVITIYINSSQIAINADLNRMMQENIKNSIEQISEDIRKNGVSGVTDYPVDTHCCSTPVRCAVRDCSSQHR